MTETRIQSKGALPSGGHAAVRCPELLHVRDGAALSFGAHQIWYPGWIQRMGGCGPTAASNLLWYLTATRPDICAGLFDGDGSRRTDMLRLMQQVWDYVTPGMRGVDKASTLADGAVRFGMDRGVVLSSRVLEIPKDPVLRPGAEAVEEFLATALIDDLPVAFLNLSNGEVRNLDNWHWVTLVSVDGALQAEMYDQGGRQRLNLALWLRTTTNGGAFVALEPQEQQRRR